MVICAAVDCDSRSKGKKRLDGESVSFFGFPRDSKRRKLWITKIKRVGLVPTSNTKLCSRHFTADQFVGRQSRSFCSEIGYEHKVKQRLVPAAVPTIFHHSRPVAAPRASATSIARKRLVTNKDEEPSTLSVWTTLDWFASATADQPRLICPNVQPPVILATSEPPVILATSEPPVILATSEPPVILSTSEPPVILATSEPPVILATSEPPVILATSEPPATAPTSQPPPKARITSVERPQLPERFNAFTQTIPRVGDTSIACQAKPLTVDFGTQTDPVAALSKLSKLTIPATHDVTFNDSFLSHVSEHDQRDDDEDDDEDDDDDDHGDDSDWIPPDVDEESFTSDTLEYCNAKTPVTERKFIVFESCLDDVMKTCSNCGDSTTYAKSVSGSYVKYKITCATCESDHEWCSQPLSGTMPLGNLLMAAGIMFSGASPIKVINALNFSNVQFFCRKTYYNIQANYLVPAINAVYKRQQSALLAEVSQTGEDVHAGGDARCCSPGHTAKYSSYSIMDLTRNKILDLQLVQSNEVKNSYAMELEGLKRCLAYLTEKEVNVTDLVTDRHSQVKKYMRESTNIRHWFDVWHVAKGIYKKLEALGKTKKTAVVGEWARSISNHIYWCAASSGGDGELVQQKWFSIMNHVTNVHVGHGDKFPECAHEHLEDRAWLRKGFWPYLQLEKVIKGRLLVKDVKKLSPAEQTSSLESYHKVVCFFAPKFVHFEFPQMQARLQLSALHFNENTNRAQAVSKNGEPQYRISYPKARQGQGVAAEVKVQQTFGYIDDLMDEVLDMRGTLNTYTKAKLARSFGPKTPVPLAQSTPFRKAKSVIVAERVQRFNS